MKLLKNFDPLSARLIFSASLSGLIYLFVFTLPFPLTQLYQTIPPVDYTKLTGYSLAGFIAYVVGLGALFALYMSAIQLTFPNTQASLISSPGSGRLIFLTSTSLAIILIFAYPSTAIDLFIYAIRTRGWALYDLNPLVTAPSALPSTDPWLGLAAEWIDAPSPYGPGWEILSLGAFYVSGGNFLAHLLALKIVGLLAYLGCTWLVYQILNKIQPEWAMAGSIAFAWNPLTLLESIQNAHNDVVMVFFLLAAVWVLNRPTGQSASQQNWSVRYSLVCLLLGLSILVKFVTALLVPFFLLAMSSHLTNWRARLVHIGGYGFLVSGLVIVLMWPLWPGWDNWAVIQASGQAGRSLLALLILAFKDAWGINFTFDLFRNLIYLIFGGTYLYYLWKTVKSGQWSVVSNQKSDVSGQNLSSLPPHSPAKITARLSSSFHVLFWYVLLVTPVFHAWYLLWFLPLASLLLPQQRPLVAAITFSMTALAVIPYFETIRVWYPVLLQNQFLGHLLGVPLLLIPPMLALWGWNPVRLGSKSVS